MKSVIYKCRVCSSEQLGYENTLPLGWGSMWGSTYELFNRCTDICPGCMDKWEFKFKEKCPVYIIGGRGETELMSRIGEKLIEISENTGKPVEDITEDDLL